MEGFSKFGHSIYDKQWVFLPIFLLSVIVSARQGLARCINERRIAKR